MVKAIKRPRMRLGNLYVLVCAGLAALAFGPTNTRMIPYSLLLVVMAPASLVALSITYLGGVLLFGSGQWNLPARLLVIVFWTALATGQMLIVRAMRAGRSRN